MSLYSDLNNRKVFLEKVKKDRIENHKCRNCVWSDWTETSYKCLLPRCMKGLGNFSS